jgi:hypothetical protein
LLGFIWLCPVRYVEDDVRCIFELPVSGAAWWDYDVWVDPRSRNGIVFAKLWQAAHEFLAKRNAHWTLSRITYGNRTSMEAHGRLGARRIGSAWFFCGRGRQLMLGTVHPRWALSRLDASPPVVRLTCPATPDAD